MSKTFAFALLATTLLAGTAQAQTFAKPLSGPYVAAQVGWNIPTHDDGTLDDATSLSGAFGYRMNPNFRLEGEISYRSNDYSNFGGAITGDAKVTNFMANAWYDFNNNSQFTPYIGGGIGAAHGSLKLTENITGLSAKDSDTVFAWQIGGGLAYDLTGSTALTTDYRYFDTSNFTFREASGASFKTDYRAHEIRVGARVSF